MGDATQPATKKEAVSSSIQCPMLTATNYTVWAMRMKVALRVHKVWEAIDPGSKEVDKNDIATALLYQSVPETLILQVGEQETAKDMWDAIKARHVGADRVREARLQTLTSEFDKLTMKETETIDDFAGKLSGLASKSAALGQVMEESKLVKKFLKCLPRQKYIQITASLEQVLDLNTTGFEDIVGRLKAYEERIEEGGQQDDCDNRLMFVGTTTEQEGGRGYGGRGRGSYHSQDRITESPGQISKQRPAGKQKKDRSKVICFRCDKPGHFASQCPERLQKIQEANLAETHEADAALYVHEVVILNEQNLIPKKYEAERKEEDIWYLDNGASNHMTGNLSYFSELNSKISGKVRFGDGSCIDIKGKGSILIQGKEGEHRLMTEIYYIPELKSNILSLGQVTEDGCEVKMKGDYLTMYDQDGILLMKVMRSPNRLYKVQLKIVESKQLRIEPGSKNYRFDNPQIQNLVVSREVVFNEKVRWNWSGSVGTDAAERRMFSLIWGTSIDTGTGPIVFDTTIEEEENVGKNASFDGAASPVGSAISDSVQASSSHGSAQVGSSLVALSSSAISQHDLGFRDVTQQLKFEPGLRSSSRQVTAPKRYEDYMLLCDVERELLLSVINGEPSCFAEAEKKTEWLKSMEEEIVSIEKNRTWTLVEKLADSNPIGLKWVFKLKKNADGSINKHKARLVAKGYVQDPGIDFDEVFVHVKPATSIVGTGQTLLEQTAEESDVAETELTSEGGDLITTSRDAETITLMNTNPSDKVTQDREAGIKFKEMRSLIGVEDLLNGDSKIRRENVGLIVES